MDCRLKCTNQCTSLMMAFDKSHTIKGCSTEFSLSMTDTPILGTVKEPQRDYRTLDRQKLTPMFQHYTEVKEQYQGALLLYRVGDFFECFFQDAVDRKSVV